MSLMQMLTTKNVGSLDRLLRTIPAIAVGIALYTGVISGWLAIVLAVVAAVLLVTALTGACSLYYLLGLSTCPISGAPKKS